MKLTKVRLRNFRCYRDEVALDVGDITTLIGRNDAGKSSVFDALEIFFNGKPPDTEDGNVSGDKKDVCIICEFEDLPDSIVVDAEHPTDLKSEYLLNAEDRLEIHKVYNCSLKSPKLSQVCAYAIHPTADGVHDLMELKNTELKQKATDLGVDTSSISLSINTQLRMQIWQSIDDLKLQPRKVPLMTESGQRIWEQLKKHLPTFALFRSDRSCTDQDEEAQDPMKVAVKEALKAREAELLAITQQVELEVKAIADKTVSKLREMDPKLASQLNPQFAPPNWANAFKIKLTGDDDIPINKRGSGVRRLILLNFFRAKAEQRASEDNSTALIYAIEEPETSQHPNYQKMLMNAFQELAEEPGSQVLLSTHTPMLAQFLPDTSLRYIVETEDGGRRIYGHDEETNQLVRDALGVLPDNKVRLFIGLEGINDINFLKMISEVLSSCGENVPNLTKLEENGQVIFVPLGGSNLVLWTSRLENLNRPEFHLFDRDVPLPKKRRQDQVDKINLRKNCVAQFTGKREMENYLHPDAIKEAKPEVNITFGDFDNVPFLAAQAIHNASESTNAWEDLKEEKQSQKTSTAKKWLNIEAARAMTPDLLDRSDPSNDVRGWLAEIKELLEKP